YPQRLRMTARNDESLAEISYDADSEEQKNRSADHLIFSAVVVALFITALPVLYILLGWENINLFLSKLFSTDDYIYVARLPRNMAPLSYDLTVKIYLPSYPDVSEREALTFDGQVEMVVDVLAPTNEIVLHMKEIELLRGQCSVYWNSTEIPIEDFVYIEERDFLGLILSKTVSAQQHLKIKLFYTGVIGSERLNGLYKTTYTDKSGKIKTAAVTHFEPNYARLMVPCFDEPEFKATWTVTVVHPKGTTALANGREISNTEDPVTPWIVSKFERTPKMSTYLLAVAVGEFEFIQQYTKRGVRFRIWSRKGAQNMTSYACSAGISCLEFFEHRLGIQYPLLKQDMLALPDFTAGAMENWGLITYRENSILYDVNIYGPLNKYSVSSTIAHELAHQWFGNLVSIKWWDDLWLKEGFATYMEHISLDAITHGFMKLKDFFIINKLERALDADALATSHPLIVKLEREIEVHEAYDAITYDKGASVLAMISAVMDETEFNEAIKYYLQKYAYDNADSKDFWESLDHVGTITNGPKGGPLKIEEFAIQWTVQMGYPLVTVKTFDSKCFEVTQSRFKIDPAAEDIEKYRNPFFNFKWDVPIWYQLDNSPTMFTWLKRDEPLYIPANTSATTIVVNAERYGFYRQNYDENGWRKIIKRLNHNYEIFSARTRNAIISDAFAAATIGRLDYTVALDLIGYLEREREFLPWFAAIKGLNSIGSSMHSNEEREVFLRFKRKLLKPVFRQSSFGQVANDYWKDQFFMDSNLQMLIIGEYCAAGAPACIAKYVKMFEEEVIPRCAKGQQASSCIKIPAPHRGRAYCYGVEKLGTIAHQKVMELYKVETVDVEKMRLLDALGCTKDVAIVKRILNSTMMHGEFRKQDIPSAFYTVARGTTEFVLDFLFERWDEIYKSLRNDPIILQQVIHASLSMGHTEVHYKKVINFIHTHPEALELISFHKSLEMMRVRINWIKKHHKTLVDYFKSHSHE
uniref:Aminopeptidase n=1 Tax=Haemonchus contortus TaxID=6289 RepID=A0A7I4YHY9_HAECO